MSYNRYATPTVHVFQYIDVIADLPIDVIADLPMTGTSGQLPVLSADQVFIELPPIGTQGDIAQPMSEEAIAIQQPMSEEVVAAQPMSEEVGVSQPVNNSDIQTSTRYS